MAKVDMSRYIECPVCHTYQITLNPCQKCLARRMAERGTLPSSGIVPLNPFKIYGQEQRALGNAPKKKRECSKESYEEMRKRMRKVAKKGQRLKKQTGDHQEVPVSDRYPTGWRTTLSGGPSAYPCHALRRDHHGLERYPDNDPDGPYRMDQ